MRPLTVRRLLWTCGGLAVLLLACVVLALKLGAVPISVTDLVLDLGRIAIGRSERVADRVPPDRFRFAPAAHSARDFGGRGAFGCGREFSGAAAQSAGRSLCSGSFERRGAGLDSRADHRAADLR